MELSPHGNTELHNFLEFLYGGLEGYAYLATRNIQDPEDWQQSFYNMPADIHRMENVILKAPADVDVFISPAVFKSPSAEKEAFKASNVVWTEFDGNAPDDYEIEPSLRIQSSTPEKQHVYWRLSEPCYSMEALETINRNITYGLGADLSGWDANQVLRPPNTINRKPEYGDGMPVKVIADSDTSYHASVFSSLPQAPAGIDTGSWTLGSVPDAEAVLLKYAFPPDGLRLLQKAKSEVSTGDGGRARALVNLAHICCEMGLSDAECFAVLRFADDRWEKFKGRKDRNKRLSHIITVARHKHPAPEDDEPFTFAFDFLSFLETEIEIDWAIDPMLMEQGTMLMVGPSGIGKTQLSLQFMIHLSLGRDFLHYKIPEPKRILFLSLEMDHGSLKKFIEQMNNDLSKHDRLLLSENFHIVPHGEPWPLNLPVGQDNLTGLLDDIQPQGVFVDSIGSAIKGSLSQDEEVLDLLAYNDRIRKQYGCFTWYIHHMRKSSNGGHTPSTQDDIYGNQYLLNRATSSYGVLRGREGFLKIRNFKNRLAPQESDYYIERRNNLNFREVDSLKAKDPEKLEYKQPEEDKGPTAGEGGFKL
jgi:hypothetical protein